MKKMRLRHPIFNQISFNTFKQLIEKSFLVRFQSGELIY